MRPQDDPTIARIREARHRISERCDHDPRRVVDYYIELQSEYQDRLLKEEPEEIRGRLAGKTEQPQPHLERAA